MLDLRPATFYNRTHYVIRQSASANGPAWAALKKHQTPTAEAKGSTEKADPE